MDKQLVSQIPRAMVVDSNMNTSTIISPNFYHPVSHFLAEQARWEGVDILMVEDIPIEVNN